MMAPSWPSLAMHGPAQDCVAWKGGLGVRVGKARQPRWKDQGGEGLGRRCLDRDQVQRGWKGLSSAHHNPCPGGARWSGGSTVWGVRLAPREPQLCDWPSPSLPFPVDTWGMIMRKSPEAKKRAGSPLETARTTPSSHIQVSQDNAPNWLD